MPAYGWEYTLVLVCQGGPGEVRDDMAEKLPVLMSNHEKDGEMIW